MVGLSHDRIVTTLCWRLCACRRAQSGWAFANLGTWVSWLQTSDYTLRARGVPRVISGVQSIISLYLVAMALLTYFGRPFQ